MTLLQTHGHCQGEPIFSKQAVDVWSSDIWSMIGGNVSRRDQSHVNTRHDFRLVRALAWSNSHTSSIDVLCY
jgi:hypothetical protein